MYADTGSLTSTKKPKKPGLQKLTSWASKMVRWSWWKCDISCSPGAVTGRTGIAGEAERWGWRGPPVGRIQWRGRAAPPPSAHTRQGLTARGRSGCPAQQGRAGQGRTGGAAAGRGAGTRWGGDKVAVWSCGGDKVGVGSVLPSFVDFDQYLPSWAPKVPVAPSPYPIFLCPSPLWAPPPAAASSPPEQLPQKPRLLAGHRRIAVAPPALRYFKHEMKIGALDS